MPTGSVVGRRPPATVLLLSLAACAAAGASGDGGAGAGLDIELARGSRAEQATADALRRRVATHDVSREEGGASGAESTWLHLVVNDMTYQALARLMGREEARRIVRESTVYPWINATVLGDPRVREVLARHRLLVPWRASGTFAAGIPGTGRTPPTCMSRRAPSPFSPDSRPPRRG